MKKLVLMLMTVMLLLCFAPAMAGAETDSNGLVWVVSPTLEYDTIRYFSNHNSGPIFMGYSDSEQPYYMFTVDSKTGAVISEVEATGGRRVAYDYGYDAATQSFFYNEEYDYHPIESSLVVKESQNTAICVGQIEMTEWGYGPAENYKWAIYYNGQFVSDFIYDGIIGGNSIAFVQQDGKYAFADSEGKLLTGFDFTNVGHLATDYYAVQKENDKWGLVDITGKEILPFIFEDALIIDEGTAFVKYDGKYGILNVTETVKAAPVAPATPAAPASSSAAPTAAKVLVNGESASFDAYNIEGNNYFKLRDLAYVLNGTAKQFEVGWDGANNAITLISGQAYTAVGGEMASGSAGSKIAALSTAKIYLDGQEVQLTAYTINGNNYFKLRDLGKAIDFGVGWDSASSTITIDTTSIYTE